MRKIWRASYTTLHFSKSKGYPLSPLLLSSKMKCLFIGVRLDAGKEGVCVCLNHLTTIYFNQKLYWLNFFFFNLKFAGRGNSEVQLNTLLSISVSKCKRHIEMTSPNGVIIKKKASSSYLVILNVYR